MLNQQCERVIKLKQAEKVEKAETAVKKAVPVFSKASILRSVRFSDRKDAVKALLKDNETYTLEQVEEILDNFMKGSVN